MIPDFFANQDSLRDIERQIDIIRSLCTKNYLRIYKLELHFERLLINNTRNDQTNG